MKLMTLMTGGGNGEDHGGDDDSFDDDDNDGEHDDDGGTDGDDDDDNDVDDVFLFSQAPHAWISACCLAGGPSPLCRGYHQGGRQHVRLSSSHLCTHASSLSGVCVSTRNIGDRSAHLCAVASQTPSFHDGLSRKPGLS